jgi:hypothetical protein
MVQAREAAGLRIDSGNVRALVFVAIQTSKRQVLQAGGTSMLLSNDVVNLKW